MRLSVGRANEVLNGRGISYPTGMNGKSQLWSQKEDVTDDKFEMGKKGKVVAGTVEMTESMKVQENSKH